MMAQIVDTGTKAVCHNKDTESMKTRGFFGSATLYRSQGYG